MGESQRLTTVVVIGIVLITLAVLAAGTYLKANGLDDGNLTTIVAGGLGALAGFVARGSNGTNGTPQA